LGIYFFPVVLIIPINNRQTKDGLAFVASSLLLMLTCSFVAIYQLIRIDNILLFGKIVAILNGLFYICFLIAGTKYRKLFLRHFMINLLLIGILI
jgi:hypothetical protein